MALRLLEYGARVARGDGQEFHLPPYRLTSGDEWGVLGGLLLNSLVASEVLAYSDLDDDDDALLSVEGAWVRRRGVRYSSAVDKVGGGAVSLPKQGFLGLEGYTPVRDVNLGLCAFQVAGRGDSVVSRVLGDISVSTVSGRYAKKGYSIPT